MAGDATPAPPQPTTAQTATWGAQHFDKAPTKEDLQKPQTESQPTPQQSSSSSPSSPSSTAPAPQKASVTDAVKSIKASDFLTVYQVPCARQGFLTGIGGGAAIGGLRYILGASIPKAANWAVGAFVAGGIVAFEVCQASRRAEVAKMKRVVEVYDRKQAEIRQREKAKQRAAAAAALEEKARLEAEAKAAKRWYKFW